MCLICLVMWSHVTKFWFWRLCKTWYRLEYQLASLTRRWYCLRRQINLRSMLSLKSNLSHGDFYSQLKTFNVYFNWKVCTKLSCHHINSSFDLQFSFFTSIQEKLASIREKLQVRNDLSICIHPYSIGIAPVGISELF